jgi:hypothetical protein
MVFVQSLESSLGQPSLSDLPLPDSLPDLRRLNATVCV